MGLKFMAAPDSGGFASPEWYKPEYKNLSSGPHRIWLPRFSISTGLEMDHPQDIGYGLLNREELYHKRDGGSFRIDPFPFPLSVLYISSILLLQ